MARLVLESPGGERKTYQLDPDRRKRVGSGPSCSIRVTHDAQVEAEHFEIFCSGGLWQVRDLGTAGGTLVNGRSVGQEVLANGDTIEIGSTRFVFVGTRGDGRVGSARTASKSKTGRGKARRRSGGRRTRARSRRSKAPVIAAVVVACALVGLLAVKIATRDDSSEVATARGADRESVAGREGATSMDRPALLDPRGGGSRNVAPSAQGAPPGTNADPSASAFPAPSSGSSSSPDRSPTPVASEPRDGDRTQGGDRAALDSFAEKSDESGARKVPDVDVGDLPNPEDVARMAEATIEIGEWTDGFLAALTLLDLDRAASWIDEAKAEGALEERLAPWTAHLERVRKARDDVLALVHRCADSKETFMVSSGTRLIPSSIRERAVVALGSDKVRFLRASNLDEVVLGDATGKEIGAFSLPWLPLELLEALVAAAKGSSPDPSAVESALTLLVYHVSGPDRARKWRSSIAEIDPLFGSELAKDNGSRWIERKRLALAKTRSLAEASDAADDHRARVAGELLRVLAFSSGTSGVEEALAQMESEFVAMRAERIPLASLFHAASAEVDAEGRLSLRYDFSLRGQALAQAADLRPVGNATQPPRDERGHLLLEGEYRLLDGDPFRDRLVVRGIATPLSPDGPNLNIAMWTRADDEVTCVPGALKSLFDLMREEPGEPADYFVFGIGYRTGVASALGRDLEEVTLVGTSDPIPLPAHVILAGTRGSRLHQRTGECIYAAPLRQPLASRVDFEIDWKPQNVDWKFDKRHVSFASAIQRSRLRAVESRTGSITIFTNGRQVVFRELEVVGTLDPAWIEERRAAMIEKELTEARASGALGS